jgi:uncharacterized protein (DUF1684 family)
MYKNRINAKRHELDRFMEYSGESPFEDRSSFQGLLYYSPNPDYKISAKFILIKEYTTTPITMNDGSTESYIRYAWVEFELGGKSHRLLVLKNRREWVTNQFFIAFTDLTSGTETYAGGRYLDVFLLEDNKITLDFNNAYNPYCVYNYNYICPIPPVENKLNIPIEAGEKLYIHDGS